MQIDIRFTWHRKAWYNATVTPGMRQYRNWVAILEVIEQVDENESSVCKTSPMYILLDRWTCLGSQWSHVHFLF
jgi:hypothetical protein